MGNPVVHFEIAGPDGPALQQFYRDLFGWNVEVAGEEMGFYGVVQANEGGIGGGIFQTDGDMPPNFVTVYVQVDDLQAALDKISVAGGASVMPPMEIAPDVGSVAMFTDTANNFMGLYSPSGRRTRGNAPERRRPASRALRGRRQRCGDSRELLHPDVRMEDQLHRAGQLPHDRAGSRRHRWRHVRARGRYAPERAIHRSRGWQSPSVSRQGCQPGRNCPHAADGYSPADSALSPSSTTSQATV